MHRTAKYYFCAGCGSRQCRTKSNIAEHKIC